MAEKNVICHTDVMIDYWDVSNTRHRATKHIIEEEIGFEKCDSFSDNENGISRWRGRQE